MKSLLVVLLARLTDRALAESVVGDLEEGRRRLANQSALRARLWVWSAAIAVVVHMATRRIVDAPRDARLGSFFGGIGGEFRQGLRALRRAPWYSATVIGVIALTMALATTVFAIVDGVLFKPLPYPRAQELHVIFGPQYVAASIANVREWVAAAPDVQMAAYQGVREVGAMGADRVQFLIAAGVGRGFFEVLGQYPLIGGFTATHFEPTSGVVPVLISFELWQRAYGGRLDVVGTRMDVAGPMNHMRSAVPGFEIAGVLGREFVFPDGLDTPDVLVPIALTPEREADRNWSYARALVRIPAGITAASVKARLDPVAERQGFRRGPEIGNPPGDAGVSINPIEQQLVFAWRDSFKSAFLAAVILIGLAAVNVGALAVARGRFRVRELAVRQALGGSRWDLFRLALLETLPVVAVGVGLASLLAEPLTTVAVSLMQSRIAFLKVPSVDMRVLAFAGLMLASLTLIVAGVQSGRGMPVLAAGVGRGLSVTPRRGPWTFLVVATQVALTLALAIGGTLLVASLWWARQQDPGFQADRAALVELTLGGGTFADRRARFEHAFERVRSLSSVRELAVVDGPFLEPAYRPPPDGMLPAAPRRGWGEQVVAASGDFFEILGLRPIAGRLPTVAELAAGSPVAVVSETVARTHWPDQAALGQELPTRLLTYRVIGVVPDARFGGRDRANMAQIYWPLQGVGTALLVRGPASGDAVLRDVLREIRAIGEPVGAIRATTFDAALADLLKSRRFDAWVYGAFAAASVVILTVGILGLVAMSTAARTREIGVRSALGASRQVLAHTLVREQLRPVWIGLGLGLLLAWWAAGIVRLSLYGFTRTDWRLWTLAVAVVLMTSIFGALIPALRASRVDPVQALRTD